MITLRLGFTEVDRVQVADMFWDAFGAKLSLPMGPKGKAVRFLAANLNPAHAISAYREGDLLGVAGFKSERGGLMGGGMADLALVYGWPGALWRGPMLDLLDRPLQDHQLLMDGIFVAAAARGQGVGSRLLRAVAEHAQRLGKTEVRLDVVAENHRAQALYLRRGFVPVATTQSWVAKRLFGIGPSTEMVLRLHGK